MLTLLLLAACVPPTQYRESSASDRLYTLGFGDTLWGVATAYNVAGGYEAIARTNGIRDPNFVLAGDKLRLHTADTTLPEVPRLTRAPSLSACNVQAIPARATSLSGCSEARCIDTGRGGSACACADASSPSLLVSRSGAAPQRLPVSAAAPWWYLGELAPEPEGSARSLVGLRAQLDADAALETVVSWRTHLGDLGMSHGAALVVDDNGAPGAQFRADNFGIGSLLQAGSRCDVLATEWELADEPGHSSSGWYLSGRRFHVEGGELVTDRSASLVLRRLFTNFQPGTGAIANVRVGAPALDLSSAKAHARTTEPSVEMATTHVQRGTLRAARRAEGKLVINIDGAEQVVDPEGNGIVRLGDLASGVLYPSDYLPGDDTTLRGRAVEVRTYWAMWGEHGSVAWVK
ncbi:hypothetical protein LBMAG42_19400 [Deltaproteobacteria bacterium]|nr:hypothetical protein LBMAG42_19400 [Deltaproteobacteria bacterium]